MVHLIQRFTKLQEKKGSNYYKYLSEKQNEYNNTQIFENTRDRDNKPMSPLKDSVITLAIGDGANDVNMITSAHVGVGIIGVEGKQAARASDYAIGQFKFLKKILFYHGHESLRRNSYIIYYNFYKNFLFVLPQFYVGFYSLFSGQSIYDPWLYQLFNILFSVLPILWFGIYDSERTTTVAMSNAKFYTSMNKQLYSNWNFWRWIFQGILQGLAIFIFVFSSNNIYANNNSGEIQDFKSSGMMTYSLVVIIVNLKVFQLTSVHGAVSLFFLVFSIGSYYILTFLMSNEPSMFYFGVFWRMIKNVRYFFILGLLCIGVTAISAGLVYLSKICYKYEENTKHDKIMYKYYKNLENDKKIKKNKNKKKQVKKKSKIKDKKVKKELIEEDNPYH
jgi:phospholipid-transporting ATPase